MARIGYTFTSTVAGSPAAAAETVIATVGPISPSIDGASILLIGWFNFLMGTSGTGYNLRIRQGSTVTGTVIAQYTSIVVLAAANAHSPSIFAVDSAAGAEQLYSLTLTCNAASATSTVQSVFFACMCL